MNDPKKIFHAISYLQYPLMLVAIVFYVPFIKSIINKNPDWTMLNYMLIFFGVGLSFSTLQDTSTTQNKLSLKIWQSPRKGKLFLLMIAAMAFVLLVSGFLILFLLSDNQFESIAVGLIVLGIGLIGLLKVAIEMFENHRLDKNT